MTRIRRTASWAAQLALQLSAVTLAIYSASRLAPRIDLLVGPLRGSKNAPLRPAEFLDVLQVMWGFHAAAYLVSLAVHRSGAFSGARRFMTEFYVAMVATSLGACWLFVLTLVPFSPNFYAHVYLGTALLYLAIYALSRRAFAAHDAAAPEFGLRHALRRVFSPALVLATCLILLPGVLALVYKKQAAFANAVNATRARFNIDTDEGWALRPILPGQPFEQPMWLQFDPRFSHRFYLLSRPGRLYAYDAKSGARELLLDISAEVTSIDSEMGALSFALHPRFGRPEAAERGYVYVMYTAYSEQRQENRLTRFDLSLPSPDERYASRLPLVNQNRAMTGQHNGGTVFFGPDGFLYFTVGDFLSENVQTVSGKLAGGVFRIDVDQRGGDASGPILVQPDDGTTANYYIPKDNPWYGQPGALGEFWALGFRNPFRASLDPVTSEVWLGDVGWDAYEEINRLQRGDNAQWPFKEGPQPGSHPKPATVLGRETPPFYAYQQTALNRAVIGGFVYRGSRLPELTGQYVFADNNSSTVMALKLDEQPLAMRPLATAGKLGRQGITAVLPSPDGGIWVTVLGYQHEHSGAVLELVRAKGGGGKPGGAAAPAVAAAASARAKFDAVCSRCHGADGRGNPELAQGAKRPDFTAAAWQGAATDQHIREVILRGGAALGLSRDMPSWQGFLTDEELDEMVKLIRRFGSQAGAMRKAGD